ncbi:hypothetical protein EYF80_064279 [Liparis tanakae]|uniref:Uncharacterized protein n=1 Tax=Liparis tanakae TaxID=230148 RepID=A0A4Z2EAK2_9TELE|nr:hypothetical protein EYF80_064279 [Liparis tanakae]
MDHVTSFTPQEVASGGGERMSRGKTQQKGDAVSRRRAAWRPSISHMERDGERPARSLAPLSPRSRFTLIEAPGKHASPGSKSHSGVIPPASSSPRSTEN